MAWCGLAMLKISRRWSYASETGVCCTLLFVTSKPNKPYEKGFVRGKFSWQEGYGVFSYSHSHIERVYNYILNQEEHHCKKTFKDEYLELLKKFEIEFKEEYVFEFI